MARSIVTEQGRLFEGTADDAKFPPLRARISRAKDEPSPCAHCKRDGWAYAFSTSQALEHTRGKVEVSLCDDCAKLIAETAPLYNYAVEYVEHVAGFEAFLANKRRDCRVCQKGGQCAWCTGWLSAQQSRIGAALAEVRK